MTLKNYEFWKSHTAPHRTADHFEKSRTAPHRKLFQKLRTAPHRSQNLLHRTAPHRSSHRTANIPAAKDYTEPFVYCLRQAMSSHDYFT